MDRTGQGSPTSQEPLGGQGSTVKQGSTAGQGSNLMRFQIFSKITLYMISINSLHLFHSTYFLQKRETGKQKAKNTAQL